MIAPILMLLMNPALDAQADGGPVAECPTFSVSSSPAETSIYFTLDAYGAPDDVTFNWVVSSGTITAGQGTPVIEVAVEKGEFVTASVEIGGVSTDCSYFVSASDMIYDPEAEEAADY